jgi:hypothetical protein
MTAKPRLNSVIDRTQVETKVILVKVKTLFAALHWIGSEGAPQREYAICTQTLQSTCIFLNFIFIRR